MVLLASLLTPRLLLETPRAPALTIFDFFEAGVLSSSKILVCSRYALTSLSQHVVLTRTRPTRKPLPAGQCRTHVITMVELRVTPHIVKHLTRNAI